MLLRFVISMTAVLAIISCSGAENAEESAVETTPTQEAATPEAETTPAAAEEPAVDPAAVKAPAQEATKSADVSLEEVNCSSGEDKRVISITKPEGKLCSVVYVKFSESNEVAWAVNDAGYCTEVKEKIMANLSAAGYSCDGQISSKSATETTPAANEASPAATETAPAATETAPTATESAPAASETKETK